MIPILYDKEELLFNTNGIGRLADAISCKATEGRNSEFEIEMQYPMAGSWFDYIHEGCYVKATHDASLEAEPFEIYSISKPIDGIVTYYAHHISYKLNNTILRPYSASTCAGALSQIPKYSMNTNPFTFETDKVTVADFELTEPVSVRNALGGIEGSILDVYGGGEYKFSNYNVYLYQNRGRKKNATIRYGLNMTDFVSESTSRESFSAVVPFWKPTSDEGVDTLVMLPEYYLLTPTVPTKSALLGDDDRFVIGDENGNEFGAEYLDLKLVTMDLSDAFESQPTPEELREVAQRRIANAEYLPTENLEVNFVNLRDTEEYKDYEALEDVCLCDTISVFYPDLGVTHVDVKVIKTEWDVLQDRYIRIELGEPKQSFSDVIDQSIESKIETKAVSKTKMAQAIQNATELITGGYGGYVYWTFLADGTPSELMFLDAPKPEDAVNVLRINKNGIGFSNNGVNGLYTNAWTIDGKLSASTILGGTLHIGGVDDSALELDGENMVFNTLVNVSEDGLDINEYQKVAVMNTKNYGTDWVSLRGFSFQVTNDIDAYMEDGISEDALDLRHFYLERNFAELGSRDNPTLLNLVDSVYIDGDLSVSGAKSREVQTDDYNGRLLYALETPSPMFSDIGECVLDDTGECLIYIDDIFSETVNTNIEYQVFLQKEGQGDCWVEDKQKTYFVINGTPNLRVAWEVKAIQRDYEYQRLEETDGLYETIDRDMMDNLLESMAMYNEEFDSLIEEGEELLDETA